MNSLEDKAVHHIQNLAKLGDQSVLPVLKAALQHPSVKVQKAAQQAIRNIESKYQK